MTAPEYIKAACLSDLPGISHGFFTRRGGVSCDDYTSLNCGLGSRDATLNVEENRRIVAGALGAADLITAFQVHSAVAVVAEKPWSRADAPKADAIVTAAKGLALGSLTADCTPVLFADPAAGIIGAAHAGWRGAAAGIVEATIAAMVELGASRPAIRAAVGPTINWRAYQVGPDFEKELMALDGGNGRFFHHPSPGGRPHFDLPAYVAARLARAGIGEVKRQTPCTCKNDTLFFSYRRAQHRKEADYGRQISAIVLI